MRTKWVICPVCEGEGKVVNPNIDDKGLTRDDFLEDPDFMEDYMSGVHDITCNACKGTGKMTEQDAASIWDRHAEQVAERRLAAQENGDFDAYCGAADPRWTY